KIGYLGIILILSTKSKTTLYKKFNSIHCVCKMHLLGGHIATLIPSTASSCDIFPSFSRLIYL
ncbi:hypothetical protein, partial [Silvanigrella sp.]|uniref:hypothetical protein n=1 Tax=Silvanigrella sp. TaxID=2024976 RepID=UPI0037CA06B2